MRDGEWMLSHSGMSVAWGRSDMGLVNVAAPDLGDTAPTGEEYPLPRADGVAFGVDYLAGRTVTFEVGAFGRTEADARRLVAAMASVWRADALRAEPGAVAELRCRDAGRERVMYGRPRRFTVDWSDAGNGVAVVTCDFVTVDASFYDGAEQVVTVSLAPPQGAGGLLAPLASPLLTTRGSDRSQVVTIGGDVAAPVRFTFRGPIVNPQLDVLGAFGVGLTTSLAYDHAVTVDPRAWSRTVRRDDGASLAGALTRRTPTMADIALRPGAYECRFSGIDATATSSVEIRWRNAYSQL